MSTIPTQNPVPSEAAKDLKFNSGKIDEFATSMKNKYTDRFGQEHFTIEGLRWVAQQAISKFGYITLDSFQKGAEITLPNQVLRDEVTGEYYRWDGWLPKSIPVGSTPDNSGGIGVGKWLSVGDSSLRSELKEKLVTKLVQTDKIKINESEITVGGSNVTFPDKDIRITNESIFIGESRIGRRIGDIYFSPFPSFELDFGEFEANGAPFSIDSQVGAALKGLSFAYRMAWGIVESSGYINLPNMYDKDGCGLYMRAGQVGDGHSDAQVPVNGSFSIKSFGTSGDVPTVIDREGAFYAESGSGTNTGTSTTPITSTATTPRPNQRVFIDSNRNHIAFIEARTKSRMMTPVIFLGVKNVTTDKGLKIDGADNKEPWFYVKQSGSQSKNTIQGVYIKSGAVYSMQPYYTSGSETHIEVSVSTINGDIANRIIYSSDGYHQGLGVASINGERYIITSASKSSSIGHQSTGIAVFAEGELKGGTENKAEIYRVFDNNTRGMVSPSITEDSSLLCVAQYNQDATEITIRVIDLYNLIKNNILNIVNEFKIKEKNPSSPMFYSAINKDRIFTLTSGGVNASDEVVISELTHKGELIASHTIKCGVSLSEAKYNGKLEPECLFFLNGELYYVPAIGESGKKVNPVYKIGELS